jgi:ketosteroid isomerase-like protein
MAFYRGIRAPFGELRIDVEETPDDKGRVVARCLVRGTDARTGTPVQFGGVAIARTRRGKIVEGWNYFDFHHMAAQISGGRPDLGSRKVSRRRARSS